MEKSVIFTVYVFYCEIYGNNGFYFSVVFLFVVNRPLLRYSVVIPVFFFVILVILVYRRAPPHPHRPHFCDNVFFFTSSAL